MSLESLINARKACRACMSNSPGELRNGAEYQFDPHVVSYWSQWLGSQRPEILIVGQDFTDWESFEQNQGVDDSKNGTNDSLRRLLALAGVLVQPAPQPDRQSPVHLTNAILCLKEPPKNRAVKRAWVRTCTERHLVKLIENLQPKYTIGLGGHGWRAVRQACALRAFSAQVASYPAAAK